MIVLTYGLIYIMCTLCLPFVGFAAAGPYITGLLRNLKEINIQESDVTMTPCERVPEAC